MPCLGCRAFIDKIYDFRLRAGRVSSNGQDAELGAAGMSAQSVWKCPRSASGSMPDNTLSHRGDVATKGERHKHNRSPSLDNAPASMILEPDSGTAEIDQ
jgi:hypothetical protein